VGRTPGICNAGRNSRACQADGEPRSRHGSQAAGRHGDHGERNSQGAGLHLLQSGAEQFFNLFHVKFSLKALLVKNISTDSTDGTIGLALNRKPLSMRYKFTFPVIGSCFCHQASRDLRRGPNSQTRPDVQLGNIVSSLRFPDAILFHRLALQTMIGCGGILVQIPEIAQVRQ
jgi:hypothetical protein